VNDDEYTNDPEWDAYGIIAELRARVAQLEGALEVARWIVDQAETDGVPVNRLAAFVPLQLIELLRSRLATPTAEPSDE